MIVRNVVKANSYADSVFLMSLANRALELPGVLEASAMMGTAQNQELLRDAGLLTADGQAARPDDLIIALRAGGDEDADRALKQIHDWLEQRLVPAPQGETSPPRALGSALDRMPEANLVLISVPGQYVRWEAQRGLEAGRHLMIFSDNVSVQDEVALKDQAGRDGLLVMGPDCGTAILGEKVLGFGNVVRRGAVGIVGASGTGIQEVSCLLDRWGEGISCAIGLGGRDLSQEVGGTTALQAIELLEADPQTAVIVLISKPPDPKVSQKVLQILLQSTKPCVVCFQGQKEGSQSPGRVHFCPLLEEVALQALVLCGGGHRALSDFARQMSEASARVKEEGAKLGEDQGAIRGLYSGGSLCAEAGVVLSGSLPELFSNLHLPGVTWLQAGASSQGHCLVDLGADEFTVGVPHPMIDFTARSRRLIQEAQDPKTAVILLDIVLGYGAHPDPAGAISPAILEGKRLAQKRGGHLCCVASICGTQGDPQDFRKQRKVLEKSGVVVMPTAAQAARFAAAVVQRGQVDWSAPEPVGDSSALQRTASQGQLPVKNLLDVPLGVINLGLPAFAQSLDQQGVPVIHVDWRPPAGGDPQLLEVLRKLR